jgi:hypothetical protein
LPASLLTKPALLTPCLTKGNEALTNFRRLIRPPCIGLRLTLLRLRLPKPCEAKIGAASLPTPGRKEAPVDKIGTFLKTFPIFENKEPEPRWIRLELGMFAYVLM